MYLKSTSKLFEMRLAFVFPILLCLSFPGINSFSLKRGLGETFLQAATAYVDKLEENSSFCKEIGSTFISELKGGASWDDATGKTKEKFQEIADGK